MAWGQGDNTYEDILTAWLDNWVDATLREENDKFAGIPPAAISYPSGQVGGSPWWNPGCHYSDKTFAFPRALSFLSEAMVLAHIKTGQEQYLHWLSTLASHRQSWIDEGRPDGEEGSRNWARQQIRKGTYNGLRKYRMWTQDPQFDALILDSANAYDQFRLLGTETDWVDSLANSAQALSWNQAAFTSEVRFTDRVIKFHSAYWNQFYEENIPKVDTDLLYNMITGDWGSPGYLPLPHFRWNFDPRQLRVHVHHGKYVELYAVADQDLTGDVRIVQQEQGKCVLSCGDNTIEQAIEDGVCTLSIPHRTLCTLEILD